MVVVVVVVVARGRLPDSLQTPDVYELTEWSARRD